MCGKLNYWLYGFRPAAAAWEKHYAGLLESVGFKRGDSCGVVFVGERSLAKGVGCGGPYITKSDANDTIAMVMMIV